MENSVVFIFYLCSLFSLRNFRVIPVNTPSVFEERFPDSTHFPQNTGKLPVSNPSKIRVGISDLHKRNTFPAGKVIPLPGIISMTTGKMAMNAFADTEPRQYGLPFLKVPETRDIIMYEINIHAFSPTDNLSGVIKGLNSIKALGANVIWLMPIYPVGKLKSIGSPYCVRNFEKINPEFGSLNELRNLVIQAHRRGMSVILDWVADHSSWDNPWISHKAWYQQDGSGNIISPPGTGWKDVAALDYHNPDMRMAMIRAMKYWILAANIDGYRCDAADRIPEDFWQQAIDSLKAIPHHKLILLAEGNSARNFKAGFQMNYGWDFYKRLKEVFEKDSVASMLATADKAENQYVPPGDEILRFTSNHDLDQDDNTPIALFHQKQGSLAAFVLALTIGGVPLIYDGQEVGCPVRLSIYRKNPIDWSTNRGMWIVYKQLISIRKTSEAIKKGRIHWYGNKDVAAYERQSGAQKVLVLVNVRDKQIKYIPDPSIAGTIWLNALDHDKRVKLPASISLKPFAYQILKSPMPKVGSGPGK